MKEETIQTQAVLTLLTYANLKNLLYPFFHDDTIPLRISNFKNSIVNKVFLLKFSQL